MNSFRIGMNSFRIKLSKGTILPFSFLLQLRLGNWKLCFLILSLHKKFYFLTLFTTPNSSIYPEWFHSGSEWIHSVLEWIHTVPEYIHSGSTFLIVRKQFTQIALLISNVYFCISFIYKINSPCYVQINIQIFCENSYLMYGYLIFSNLILY